MFDWIFNLLNMAISAYFEIIWNIAATEAADKHFKEIDPEHFLLAILKFGHLKFKDLTSFDFKKQYVKKINADEFAIIQNSISETLEKRVLNVSELTDRLNMIEGNSDYQGTMHRSEESLKMFGTVKDRLQNQEAGTSEIRYFLEYILDNPTPALESVLHKFIAPSKQIKSQELYPLFRSIDSVNHIHPKDQSGSESFVPPEMIDLEKKLSDKIFGQDDAIKAFTDAINNALIFSEFDKEKQTPHAVLLFAGPPGVGKTYLAETGAKLLCRHYKRFDMSGYAEHHQHEALIGLAKGYREARSGLLTEEVKRFPDSILLFDEIEKAHINTIHLFLQILDSGLLEDKYTLEEVSFSKTIIIFTTNAGKKLYDNHDFKEVTSFHSKTLLNAIENETDPETQKPKFPPSICSRLSTGYVILFKYLRINDLVNIANSVLKNFAESFYKELKIKINFDNLIPYLLVLKEGVKPDARTISSQASKFVKNEVVKNLYYVNSAGFKQACSGLAEIYFSADDDIKCFVPDGYAQKVFTIPENPTVLLITDPILVENYIEKIKGINWISIYNREGKLQYIQKEKIDLVLLDPWVNDPMALTSFTYIGFPVSPSTSRRFDFSRQLYKRIAKELSDTPVYILRIENKGNQERHNLEEELVKSYLMSGWAKGTLRSKFTDSTELTWNEECEEFKSELLSELGKLYFEKAARKLGLENKVLYFETAPKLNDQRSCLNIRIRNPRITREIVASDLEEVLGEVERPSIRFSDVLGADEAKKELQFIIEYIKDHEKYLSVDIKPPRGVLLYGPSGTGKTMLARAFAGESDMAFLQADAASFITMWKGSGPQNVRDLFARARKYAPSVIFIDEIDAIGKKRSGDPLLQTEESTLNALLVEMDGFMSQSSDRPLFVLSATNYNINDSEDLESSSTISLDPALLRRFSRKIFIDLPDKVNRLKFLKSKLLGRPGCTVKEANIDNIADRSSGMSYADLESVVESAARDSAMKYSELDINYLDNALEKRFGDSRPIDKTTLEHIAWHEASHVLTSYLAGVIPAYVTIVSRGNHCGYMAPVSSGNESVVLTKQQLLMKVRIALAGRAIEHIKYGDNGLTTGAARDLEYAADIVHQMICSFGMYEEYGLYVKSGSTEINQLVNKVLEEQLKMTKELLEENMKILGILVQKLIQDEKMTSDELKNFFKKVK
jgi:cell division protease FtsH